MPAILKLTRQQLESITENKDSQKTIEQLLDRANSLIGSVTIWLGNTVPDGYIELDGSELNRSAYPEFFSIFGTAWGSGDGSTTFNIPDCRGYFLRGRDHGAGNDPDASSRTAQATGGNTGDNIGSVQTDALQAFQVGADHDNSGALDYWGVSDARNYWNGIVALSGYTPLALGTTRQGDNRMLKPMNDGTNGDPRTTSETRPINVNVMFIIRYQ